MFFYSKNILTFASPKGTNAFKIIFKSTIISRGKIPKWSVSAAVSTPPFHGGGTGSIPVQTTTLIINIYLIALNAL